jgi:hypothetical protein
MSALWSVSWHSPSSGMNTSVTEYVAIKRSRTALRCLVCDGTAQSVVPLLTAISRRQQQSNSSLYPAQKRLHRSSCRRLQPTRRARALLARFGRFCQLLLRIWRRSRPNESHLLALCARIGFGGKVLRRDVPTSERTSRRHPAPEHHLFLRLSTKGSNAETEISMPREPTRRGHEGGTHRTLLSPRFFAIEVAVQGSLGYARGRNSVLRGSGVRSA